ncbi:ATP-binding protein [Verminephrobacter eiseniae]|nr:ATP-binding protein [Verminephrobacter eiseniae]MCW8188301.1 ATP-binding protein [Verminephrobacter eiseniae]
MFLSGDGKWPVGTKAYAMALDVQLLAAYNPDWMHLGYDETAMSASCPQWRGIRERIQRLTNRPKEQVSFGVFMLWPKVLADLAAWDAREQEQRLILARVVFSLSSVGATDWFIKEALTRCPALQEELGDLVHPSEIGKVPSMDREEPLVPVVNAAATACQEWRASWDVLLERLECLTERLKQPSLEGVTALEQLCGELGVAVQQMPSQDVVERARLEAAVKVLADHCRSLSQEPVLDGLVDELVGKVPARWQLAQQECTDAKALAALADDAERAMSQTIDCAERLRQAWQERTDLEKAVDQASAAITSAKPFAERRVLELRRQESYRLLADAEAAVSGLEADLLASASPFEKSFDRSSNYQSGQLLQQDGQTNAVLPEIEAKQPVVEPVPAEIDAQPKAQTQSACCELVLEQHTAPLQATPPIAAPPVMAPASEPSVAAPNNVVDVKVPTPVLPAEFETNVDDNLYSVEAGELCKPIWTLLGSHQLGLAYQFTKAIAEQKPTLRVPPPALLAAVTLAKELALPDGAIREALTNHLNELTSDMFVQDGPYAWHTALNLLLVAATLRPMVLAPGVGATTAAGYLRLSNYPALYRLVVEIKEFSERLQGFRIEPAALKAARSEAGMREELAHLQRGATEWLGEHAPAMTMKFAAATNVWRHWTKPQGVLHQLVSIVAANRSTDLQHAKSLVMKLSDPNEFSRLVRETDRKILRRIRGEDIHSGALDQLQRSVAEARTYARKWIILAESEGQSGNRLRELLHEVRQTLSKAASSVDVELANGDPDEWGLVAAARSVVSSQFKAMRNLFDPAAELLPAEPTAAEALARAVLLVPCLHLHERWELRTELAQVVSAIAQWSAFPGTLEDAFRARLESGDLFGAELIVQKYPDFEAAERWRVELKRMRESWRNDLNRRIAEARRDMEVGRAYGYLNDQDLGHFETELRRCQDRAEQGQFDVALAAVDDARKALAEHRAKRTQQVQRALSEINRTAESAPGIDEVERVLRDGDVATAHELLQRLVEGKPVWPEEHALVDGFKEFFPHTLQTLDAWLDANSPRSVIEGAMRSGQKLGALDFDPLGTAQREHAVKLFGLWSEIKSKKRVDAGKLESLFSGLGFQFKRIQVVTERPSAREEVWSLELEPMNDRAVCPVPHFGSMAKGRYRVICVWEQLADEDILQLVGDPTLQKPTIVLHFTRIKERRRRELARIAKTSRKAFLLVDELMLIYLLAQSTSKVSGLFQLALPFAYSTPYDATAGLVPPEMFYGRSAELDAVKGINGRCFIYGGRQLGKTALLRRAEQSFHAPDAGRFSRWVDLRAEGIGVSRQAEEIWVCLAEQLKLIKVLEAVVPIPSPSRKGSIDTIIQEIRHFLGQDDDRRILLLLDEADRFFEQDGKKDFAETRRLKQLMDETSRHFKVVFAGLHNVLRMTERANHPLAHFGEPIKVGPLVDEDEVKEAEELVRRPMAAAGFEFESRNLVIRILAQTNYYPSLIQFYCSRLLGHMQSRLASARHPPGPRYIISDKDIESVYSSGELRDEIRSKFRLTLQLDPRYEVVAYALAWATLEGTYKHADGLNWKSIREKGALHWWPEGFQDTSERDFCVLLDEMVELGVLSRAREGYYTLRNLNILLLLGSRDEIEAVLVKDREPSVEFELSSFRPSLKSSTNSPQRNPLTYQQLDKLMRRENTVTAIAGSHAGGISDVIEALRDYVGETAQVKVLEDDCLDTMSFTHALDRALKARETEGNTLVLVPATVAWSSEWIEAGRQKLNLLRSPSKFVSLVFLANPVTLWGAMSDRATFADMQVPWMSLLPWADEFVKHWLTEQQLPSEKETRQQVRQVTGYWASALQDLVRNCNQESELKRRIESHFIGMGPDQIDAWAKSFGFVVCEPQLVLCRLAAYCEPVTVAELAELAEVSLEIVERSLRWADLLGLVVRGGGDYWSLDPFISGLLNKLEN